MIVLLRSTDGNPDSRLEKYVKALELANYPYMEFCWDRKGKFENTDNILYYKEKALYGNGWKNLRGLLGFNVFLIKKLFKYRKKYSIIHACDFDTILPAILMKLFFRKKIVYDIFDWYVDSREIKISFVRYFILLIEFINLKISDVTVICEEERIKQLCTVPRKLWVLPNIPNLDYMLYKKLGKHAQINISYVGVFVKHRGIEKILKLVMDNPSKYKLDIAGFGELEPLVSSAAKSCPNIIYHGSVKYTDGLGIMANSDIILAIYEKTIPNHIYAAPNKYYEGLCLGVPILTTIGTYVGTKTEVKSTGFVVGETYKELDDFFKTITIQVLEQKGKNALEEWNTKYKSYINYFMHEKYLPFIYRN